MTKLPDRAGDLIRLAVKDLTLCEANPEYEVYMDSWHEYNEEVDSCYVCLAGSVIAQRLEGERLTTIYPAEFDEEIESKLTFLDLCRHIPRVDDLNTIVRPLPSFKNYEVLIESDEFPNVANYHKYPGQFKEDMLALAGFMDKYNVHYTGD